MLSHYLNIYEDNTMLNVSKWLFFHEIKRIIVGNIAIVIAATIIYLFRLFDYFQI